VDPKRGGNVPEAIRDVMRVNEFAASGREHADLFTANRANQANRQPPFHADPIKEPI